MIDQKESFWQWVYHVMFFASDGMMMLGFRVIFCLRVWRITHDHFFLGHSVFQLDWHSNILYEGVWGRLNLTLLSCGMILWSALTKKNPTWSSSHTRWWFGICFFFPCNYWELGIIISIDSYFSEGQVHHQPALFYGAQKYFGMQSIHGIWGLFWPGVASLGHLSALPAGWKASPAPRHRQGRALRLLGRVLLKPWARLLRWNNWFLTNAWYTAYTVYFVVYVE